MELDYDDEAIRDMVLTNHVPKERWDQRTAPATVEVFCEMDHERWPCASIRQLRAWRTRNEVG